MADHYPYRIASGRADLILIWQPGKDDAPDALAVDDVGRLLAFPDLDRLQRHCEDNGWGLVREGEGTLDLDDVRGWVEHPHLHPPQGSVSAGLLLDAWNFFDDLSHTLKAESALTSQGPVHDNAYEKIFGGEALATDAGDGAWTVEETAAVRALLRAGLNLWDRAVQGDLSASGGE
ncbi:hypothetical protein PV728_38410 [Streptomyces europaeiscabiei]|uniref:hypothetical protein n=1 Tax=Streptomyces europaeiscabiei TaxID=146819 RepID=UPI0029AF4CCA|nr:hypothetical protein [Streptomyces europaeiscabiei]MDX3636012.1 hypothetical protein [Streptomyces europaeiscabiei]MDX3654088.1 hypothetical protein [Streptomyces europaeiscabiei]